MLGMVPGKHEHIYHPLVHVLMVFSAFSVIFAVTFKKDILPLISEGVLLSYTLVFWFAFLTSFYTGTPLHMALLLLLLVPTALALFVAVRKTRLGFVFKLALYTWFLVIIVSLGLFQFPYNQLKLFLEDHQVPWVTPFESVTAGMAFMFLLANATYIFYLIPIPGRNQSWAERMRDWHAFTDLMTQRFADARVTLVQATVVLGLEGSALLLLASYRWLPPALVINVAIVIPAIVMHPRFPLAPDPASKSSPPQPRSRGPLKVRASDPSAVPQDELEKLALSYPPPDDANGR